MKENTPSRSFEKFNYNLRPAKNIERKMMVEAFHRLSSFSPIADYLYVGMGSLYFSDFVLFHRSLNFERMVSIEASSGEKDKDRFNFNGSTRKRVGKYRNRASVTC